MDQAKSLRARRRDLVRHELAVQAADYCAEHGFEELTTDQLAQGTGVSRATFFRYFASKEDAVVSAALDSKVSLSRVLASLSFDRSGLWQALETAAAEDAAGSTISPERLRSWRAMITGSSALRAQLAYHRAEERAELTALLMQQIEDDAVAVAYANATFAALDTAWTLWARDSTSGISSAVARAFAMFSQLSNVHSNQ